MHSEEMLSQLSSKGEVMNVAIDATIILSTLVLETSGKSRPHIWVVFYSLSPLSNKYRCQCFQLRLYFILA
jgi:hypothetical protein